MKILELTNYSAGICGVFARVKQEAVLLAKGGNEVRIFSSNITKGTGEIAKAEDRLEGVKIKRFHSKSLGGESYMFWDFEKEALKFKPDVIIAHAYRHPHTSSALKIAKKINAKVFLVSHGPFNEDESNRSIPARIAVGIYDSFVGPKILDGFDKIFIIAKWEIPYLKKLGVKENKIEYIPNGIPDDFFKQKNNKEENKILFLGRIAPIKDLEILLNAIQLIKDNKIKLEIVGPAEIDYLHKLKQLINEQGLQDRIIFSPAIYDMKEKIEKIDSCKIFVLPSKRESMPQALIEAMARKKIVISSSNIGSKELIQNGKNGYLFKIGDAKELAEKIDFALKSKKDVGKEARKSVEQFSWGKIIKKIENAIR